MTSRQVQMAERVARQTRIDETCVEPMWSKLVEVPLIEMCFASSIPPIPVVLMPELRFKSLLQRLVESFPRVGKVMIVDESNARFEMLRHCVPKTELNMYYSAQEVCALNYAGDIFHFALTEVGLSTLMRFELVLPSYRRVLRPGGHLVFDVPLLGSFPAFFDILEEALVRLYPDLCDEIMGELRSLMTEDRITEMLDDSGFTVEGSDHAQLEISFSNVEQLLFSTIVESHYLGLCMGLRRYDIDAKALLTLIVRSFHHYFQGEPMHVPMNILMINAVKSA